MAETEDSAPNNEPVVTDPSVVVPEACVELTELVVQGEYVLGFPMHVALTLAPEPRAARINGLPLPSMAHWANAIGVTLRPTPQHPPLLTIEAAPVADSDAGVALFSLGPDEERRILLDLADVVPPTLPVGSFELSIYYDGENLRTGTRTAAFVVRRPTDEEAAIHSALGPEWGGTQRCGAWLDELPAAPLPNPNTSGIETRSLPSLHYARTVRYLKYGGDPLEDIDPSIVDAFDPFYAPEAAAWTAELLVARGNTQAATALIQQVRNHYAGLTTWMNQLESGTSWLALARRSQTR